MCLTTDVITLYALNRSWNHLDSPDFSPFWVETLKAIVEVAGFVKFFPWVLPLTQALPMSVIKAISPGMAMLFDYQHVRSQTNSIPKHFSLTLQLRKCKRILRK
jgi:hypothetical protein